MNGGVSQTDGSPSPDAPSARARGRLLVISGPSGSGKTSVAHCLLRDPDFERARTATTRAPRDGEVHGRDYDFLTREAFREGLARGDFLEHAEVYGDLYGTPRANPEAIRAAGRSCVLVVDVQGACSLRRLGVDGTFVFVKAPSREELRRRLESRGLDDPRVIERRLDEADHEEAQVDMFDLVLVNDEIEATARRLAARAGLEWRPVAAGE